MSIRDLLTDRLTEHEGLRLKVYDDKTGRDIVPGTVVEGHPTIGIGRALDTNGIDRVEALFLLHRSIAKTMAEVDAALPWVTSLDVHRASVIYEMAYQMGTAGLLKFVTTLADIRDGNYHRASVNMLASKWARQTPNRVKTLARIIETGQAHG